MTPQESAMLHDLLNKVQQTRLTEKDPDAQHAIDDTIGSNADSLYILAQTVLVQNIALSQAKSQIDQLRQQITDARQHAAPLARASSFLGSLLGHNDPPPQPPPQPRPQAAAYSAPPAPGYAAPPYQPVQGYAPPPGPYAAPYASSAGGMGGFGGPPSFLRSAATTAAGVAAGALAFEGVESLLHGFGHGGGFGGGGFGSGGFGGAPIEENVVNNYYEDAGTGHDGSSGEHEHTVNAGGAGDVQGQGDAAKLDTASYDTSGSTGDPSSSGASYDPANYDPSGTDTGDQDDTTVPDLNATDDTTAFDDSNDNLGGDVALGDDNYDPGGDLGSDPGSDIGSDSGGGDFGGGTDDSV